MNHYTDAENNAAANAAEYVRELMPSFVEYAAPEDRDAAAGALCARVAEMLLGSDFVVMPRYVVEALRKQLEDVQ